MTTKDGGQEVIEDISGVTDVVAESLCAGGVETVGDVRDLSHDDLAAIEGIGHALAARIKADAYQSPSWAREGEDE